MICTVKRNFGPIMAVFWSQIRKFEDFMRILRLFTQHPHEIGENYVSHGLSALKIALKFAIAAQMQVIHAIFPFICPPLGSDAASMVKFLEKMSPKARKKANFSSKKGL